MKKSITYTGLVHGELYVSTKEHIFSIFDEKYSQISVPAEEILMFRSFQPYGKCQDSELALFYWFKHRKTMCLLVGDKTPILHLKHVDWEKRHELDGRDSLNG